MWFTDGFSHAGFGKWTGSSVHVNSCTATLHGTNMQGGEGNNVWRSCGDMRELLTCGGGINIWEFIWDLVWVHPACTPPSTDQNFFNFIGFFRKYY